MRETFREKKFSADSTLVVQRANSIIATYQQQNLRLTARQLYYQFVTRNWVTNEDKSYKRLTSIVSDARLAGYLDWDAIEDRGREPDVPGDFEDLDQLVKAALGSYKLPRWKGQPYYAELWVEKQALAGVLEPLARRFHVPLVVNKGYSSQSAMYAAAKRFRTGMGTEGEREEVGNGEDPWYTLESEREGIVFYLGDFDPSGEDMVRDIRERLQMFGCGDQLTVQKLGLTWAQIQHFKPPPNPAKITDPRAAKFVAQHGRQSWEVDSLDPPELARIITRAFKGIIDQPVLDDVLAQEASDKTALTKALEKVKQ